MTHITEAITVVFPIKEDENKACVTTTTTYLFVSTATMEATSLPNASTAQKVRLYQYPIYLFPIPTLKRGGNRYAFG